MSSDEEELTLAEVAKQQKRTPLHQRKERDDDDDDDDEITLAEIAEKRSKETGGHPKRATPIIDDHASSRRSSGLVMFVGDDRDYARSAKKRHVRDEVAHDGTEYGDDGDSFIVEYTPEGEGCIPRGYEDVKIGDKDLEITTLESIVAMKIYGKSKDEGGVYRRMPVISNILVQAGICENIRNGSKLKLI